MDYLDLLYHQIRTTWEPLLATCIIANIHSTKLNMITALITDVVLLLIMLIGLLRLGFHEPGVFGIGYLMWKQVSVSVLFVSGVSYPLICSPFARVSFGSSLPPSSKSRQW